MRRSFRGAAGITVTRRTGEGWLIVIGQQRLGEDAAGSVAELDALLVGK
jgi:hypothetical protein